jgi:hypothetical protein
MDEEMLNVLLVVNRTDWWEILGGIWDAVGRSNEESKRCFKEYKSTTNIEDVVLAVTKVSVSDLRSVGNRGIQIRLNVS